ncbi:hypothetical protein GCM10027299_42010 [Larkinella ripae]
MAQKTYLGAISVADAAKKLGLTRPALFSWLQKEMIVEHDGRSNIPDPKYIEAGWFKTKENFFWRNAIEIKTVTLYVTPVGLREIKKWLAGTGLAPQLNLELSTKK